jgi:hypothetical protein
MIGNNDMFELMLLACPICVPAWRAFLNERDGRKKKLSYYAGGHELHNLVTIKGITDVGQASPISREDKSCARVSIYSGRRSRDFSG